MSKKFLVDIDLGGVARVVGALDGVSAQDYATVNQLNSAIEGLAWKDSCRVASTANINLAAPGATIDAISMAANDRFLAKNQTAGAENGIYIWNGAATPATRAPDMSTAAEVEQAVTTVEEGTAAGATYRQTVVNVTLGTTTLTWTLFGTSAPAASETTAGIAEIATQAETDTGTDDARMVTPLKLATYVNKKLKLTNTIGDGSSTSIAVTHNFNTKALLAQVYRTGSPFDYVECDIQQTSVNQMTFIFASAPAAGAYTYVILG